MQYSAPMGKNVFPIPFMPYCPMLAFAYVPYQYMCKVYTPEEGISMGTIFPELVQPPSLYDCSMCEEEL